MPSKDNIIRMLNEYRYKPTGISAEDHYQKWLNQFSSIDHDAITEVLNHILSINYYSEQRYGDEINKLVQLMNPIDPKTKTRWAETCLLCPDTKGKSQLEIKEKLEAILSAYGMETCKDPSNCKRYLYLDDFSFTGERLYNDMWDCYTKNLIDKTKKVYCYFFAVHTKNIRNDFLKKRIKAEFQIDVEIRYSRILKNTFSESKESEVLWPTIDVYNKYNTAKLNAIFQSNFRGPLTNTTNLFCNVDIRTKCEELFFLKGCPFNRSYWSPMGGKCNQAGYLGFGATIFSYRNASNALPLVFWWGDYSGQKEWYPLIRRYDYSQQSIL